MTIIDKISITFSPDTQQRAYMGMSEETRKFEELDFNDGSIRITIPEGVPEHRYCRIEAYLQNMNDLMIVAQIKDIVQNLSKAPKLITLAIRSPIYTRYDRVMLNDKTDSFGLKVFADFVNSIGFDFVEQYDAHSDVSLKAIHKSIPMLQKTLLNQTVGPVDRFVLIAPDKGAVAKNPKADIVLLKDRDVTTGKILGTSISTYNLDRLRGKGKYLIVDDLCEGGRTFIEAAKRLKSPEAAEAGIMPKELSLYVSHGVCPRDSIDVLLEYFDYIYIHTTTKDVLDRVSEKNKSRVVVHTLIV